MVFLILVIYPSFSIVFDILEVLFRVFWYSTTLQPLPDPEVWAHTSLIEKKIGTEHCQSKVVVQLPRIEQMIGRILS